MCVCVRGKIEIIGLKVPSWIRSNFDLKQHSISLYLIYHDVHVNVDIFHNA